MSIFDSILPMPTGLAVGLAPKDWRYAAVAAIRPRGGPKLGTSPQWFPRFSGMGPDNSAVTGAGS